MPKGFAGAQKATASMSGGGGMIKKPKGVTYFRLKNHNESAVIRFVQNHDDIEWARKWKLPPNSQFRYGEEVNCVDQFDDGTPDPGFAANLRSTWKAYPLLIWRNAPVYAKDAQGNFLKDGNGNRQITGYADQLAVWECSNKVYTTLQSIEGSIRGLANQDLKVTRIGTDQNTVYNFFPEGMPGPLSPADQMVVTQQRIDVSPFVKIPTFDELQAYLNGGVPAEQPQTFPEMAMSNASAGDGANPFM